MLDSKKTKRQSALYPGKYHFRNSELILFLILTQCFSNIFSQTIIFSKPNIT